MFFWYFGGWGEIRTHGALACSAVFKTAALNRSATHPKEFDDNCLSFAKVKQLKQNELRELKTS